MVLACDGLEEPESTGRWYAQPDSIVRHRTIKATPSPAAEKWAGEVIFQIRGLKILLKNRLDATLWMGVGVVGGQTFRHRCCEEPRISRDKSEIEKTSRL